MAAIKFLRWKCVELGSGDFRIESGDSKPKPTGLKINQNPELWALASTTTRAAAQAKTQAEKFWELMARILFLVPTFDASGPLQQLLLLRGELERLGNEVWFLALYGEVCEAVSEKGESLNLRNSFDPRAFSRIRTFLRQKQIDMLHSRLIGANFWGAALYSTGIVAAHVLNVTNSLHLSFGFQHGRLKGFLLQSVFRRILNGCSVICVNSSYLERELRTEFTVSRPMHVIFNSMPVVEDHGREEALDFTVAIVSRLVANKRPQDAIQAVALAMREIENMKAVVLGDGPELADCRDLVATLPASVASRFYLAGLVKDAKGMMRAFSLLVSSSESEGQPNAILEAMSHGVPVISSRYPGVEDIILDGTTGLLFDIGDSHACAIQIRRLFEDGDLRVALAKNSREHLRRSFSPISNARRYDDLYRKVLGVKGDITKKEPPTFVCF